MMVVCWYEMVNGLVVIACCFRLYSTADATVVCCLCLLESLVLQLLQCNRILRIDPLDPFNLLLPLYQLPRYLQEQLLNAYVFTYVTKEDTVSSRFGVLVGRYYHT